MAVGRGLGRSWRAASNDVGYGERGKTAWLSFIFQTWIAVAKRGNEMTNTGADVERHAPPHIPRTEATCFGGWRADGCRQTVSVVHWHALSHQKIVESAAWGQ